MTSPSVLLPFLLFAIVMTGTPGPNNAMVLLSGARVGVVRSLPLVAGIAAGVGLQFAILGLGLGAVFESIPGFHLMLGVVGTVYIAWLAWKIARSGPMNVQSDGAPLLGFFGAAAFQWVNPKAWAVSISAAAAYVPADNPLVNVSIAAALLAGVSIPCVGIWAIAGVGLRNVLKRPRVALVFNVCMAVLLMGATIPALFRLIHTAW